MQLDRVTDKITWCRLLTLREPENLYSHEEVFSRLLASFGTYSEYASFQELWLIFDASLCGRRSDILAF